MPSARSSLGLFAIVKIIWIIWLSVTSNLAVPWAAFRWGKISFWCRSGHLVACLEGSYLGKCTWLLLPSNLFVRPFWNSIFCECCWVNTRELGEFDFIIVHSLAYIIVWTRGGEGGREGGEEHFTSWNHLLERVSYLEELSITWHASCELHPVFSTFGLSFIMVDTDCNSQLPCISCLFIFFTQNNGNNFFLFLLFQESLITVISLLCLLAW